MVKMEGSEERVCRHVYLRPTVRPKQVGEGESQSVPEVSCVERQVTEGALSYVQELCGPGDASPADCGSPVTPPPWLNKSQIKRGQEVFHRHFINLFVSNLIGLLCILTLRKILNVLSFTGRSSCPLDSFRRYLGTLNHVRRWYSADIFDPTSSAYKSVQMVRRMHTNAFTTSQEKNGGLSTQADMVVTQWAFFGLALTHAHQLGFNWSTSDQENLVHFWKAVGYLLGIEDKYNLAVGELEEVRAKCRALEDMVIKKGLTIPPTKFFPMSDAMLKGVHMISPPVDPDAFMAYTFYLFKLQHNTANMSWYSLFMYKVMIWNFQVFFHIPVVGHGFRIFQNSMLQLNLFILNTLPTLPLCIELAKTFVTKLCQNMATLIQKTVVEWVKKFCQCMGALRRSSEARNS